MEVLASSPCAPSLAVFPVSMDEFRCGRVEVQGRGKGAAVYIRTGRAPVAERITRAQPLSPL